MPFGYSAHFPSGTTMLDTTIQEVRKIRDEYARQFNYFLYAIWLRVSKSVRMSDFF